MKIVLNSFQTKKTLIISSIGVCVLGALIVALKTYFKNRKKRKRVTSDVERETTRSPSELRQITNATLHNLPSEDLLELGLNYLEQAIKCWETALDSIDAQNMSIQGNALALPNNDHAELVYKLRCLVERANVVDVNLNQRLTQSSKTLQIIQSRISYKQQKYADALLSAGNSYQETTVHMAKSQVSSSSRSRSNYLSDEEDYVSAESDAEWVEDDAEIRLSLYEFGLKETTEGRVSYRENRARLLGCKNDRDFCAKLYAVRLGLDKLFDNPLKREWLTKEGRTLIGNFFNKAEKDPSKVHVAYDRMIEFALNKSNWQTLKDELGLRKLTCFTFYDVVLDFILLDSFDDLDSPPSAILAVVNNRWLSQNFKEKALATAVWSVLKAKRKILKYPNGFISHFYSINEHLVPLLAWGFLGNDNYLNELCLFLKEQVVDYLKCLFDLNKTRYTNLNDLTHDIELHTIEHLRILNSRFII